MHVAHRVRSEKSGNHRLFVLFKHGADAFVGLFRKKRAFFVKQHDVFGVDKRHAQSACRDLRAQIFSARRAKLRRAEFDHILFDAIEFGANIHIQPQIADDAAKALANLGESSLAFPVDFQIVIASIQQVGDFMILREPLARRRNDDVATRRIGFDDFGDLIDGLGVRHGRSAEFDYFQFHKGFLLVLYVPHFTRFDA